MDFEIKTESAGIFTINQPKFDKCYYAFQFNDDEPIIFAHSSNFDENTLTIKIDRTKNGNLIFHGADNQTFKIFVKEHED